ncbi:recQ-mediated genome instability protein 1 [Dermatophagoides pteronyssinus]|uniref:RecQ-mediated genome instability protein 1 n=1 Tax=Dermatophagoides pteronyssinus TaxID=6956 RepID=A0ABQ8J4F1_DERPT|nr:recQ-mediated genome instability protein 1 [Dermatophagoides pteronyssinus]
MNFRNNQILKKIRNVIYEQQQQQSFFRLKMTLSGNLEQLKQFFHDNHANNGLNKKFDSSSSTNINDFNKIFQQWLNEDWIETNEWCSKSLPDELNLNLFNIEKQTFNGYFILQVEKMIDISRPLPTKINVRKNVKAKLKEKQRKMNDNKDDELENGEEKPETKGKKNQNLAKFYGYGRRLWQFCLTDGYQKCLAIEYEPINWLKQSIIGHKILLYGSFDVYMGTILLKASNIKLLSTTATATTIPKLTSSNSIDLNEILEDYDVELQMEALSNQDDTWKS